ncbi:MAG: MEDS domain-containing protein [Candidatus Schekmanbacteria bacterium]|nr:MEDS domain-containing protein [Candidatus Schekmanbacteria bacterium]
MTTRTDLFGVVGLQMASGEESDPARRRRVTDLQSGDHLCVHYSSDDEQSALLADFLSAGIAAQDCLLCVVDARGRQAFESALYDLGVAGDELIHAGRLAVFLPPTQSGSAPPAPDALVSWLLAEADRARDSGFARIRLAVEVAGAARYPVRACDVRDLDANIDSFLTSHSAVALCLLDRRSVPP